ncbi:MAG: DUF4124 domain-containing protein [Gammaproteobacteria bacterium]|nr:DUF4124 domain-containing protein [Gammaproteobacteria bacterium]
MSKQLSAIPLHAVVVWALLIAPVSAEVFRWLDPQGQVQFGDRPPPGARQVEPMDIDLGQRINPDVDAAQRVERLRQVAEELERARLERESARAAAAQAVRQAASLCAQYRDRARLLADDGVSWIKGRNPDGSNIYYSAAEVARLRVEAARGVQTYCR